MSGPTKNMVFAGLIYVLVSVQSSVHLQMCRVCSSINSPNTLQVVSCFEVVDISQYSHMFLYLLVPVVSSKRGQELQGQEIRAMEGSEHALKT